MRGSNDVEGVSMAVSTWGASYMRCQLIKVRPRPVPAAACIRLNLYMNYTAFACAARVPCVCCY